MNNTSVLIPHYNDVMGLKKTISSISNHEKVDVLVVDDGSSIPLNESEIRELFKANGEIKVKYLEKNSGIENALNTGLNILMTRNYKYVARLDSGDLCLPRRFEKQEFFLDKNKKIYLVGSWAQAIDKSGEKKFVFSPPSKHKQIKKRMYFNSMILHPTAMFRLSAVNEIGMYPLNYPAAEDYAYFFRFSRTYRTANIPEILIKFTVADGGISATKRKIQVKSRVKVIIHNFYWGYYPIMGILRNIILYFMSPKLILRIKYKLHK